MTVQDYSFRNKQLFSCDMVLEAVFSKPIVLRVISWGEDSDSDDRNAILDHMVQYQSQQYRCHVLMPLCLCCFTTSKDSMSLREVPVGLQSRDGRPSRLKGSHGRPLVPRDTKFLLTKTYSEIITFARLPVSRLIS